MPVVKGKSKATNKKQSGKKGPSKVSQNNNIAKHEVTTEENAGNMSNESRSDCDESRVNRRHDSEIEEKIDNSGEGKPTSVKRKESEKTNRFIPQKKKWHIRKLLRPSLHMLLMILVTGISFATRYYHLADPEHVW